jgi:peptide/nickel transport system permease protein
MERNPLKWLVANRIGVMLVTMLFVSMIVFATTEMLPGDVAEIVLGQNATPEAVKGLRQAMNLDEPAVLRYLSWLKNLMVGDLGQSLVNNIPISDMLGARLGNSLLLAGFTALVSVPIALLLGTTAAIWRGTPYDYIVGALTISVVSVPEFLVATVAVLVFSVHLHWLPALSSLNNIHSITDLLRVFAMPVMVLSFVISAQMIRMTRAVVIEALRSPYIEMATLKGVSPTGIVLKHALPNTVGPVANAVALSLSYLLGGVIIVETIFNYPGVAKLMVDAVSTRDMPLIQACAMIFSFSYLMLVTIADILAIIFNPRLRRS